jgi:hypothetical protein
MGFIDGKAISCRTWASGQMHFFFNNGFDVFFLQGLKLSVSEALGTNFVRER